MKKNVSQMINETINRIKGIKAYKVFQEIRNDINYIRMSRLPLSKYEKTIAKLYFRNTKSKMDFENPRTFTQKQQWLKLYDYNPEKVVMSDKYAVRSIIKERFGEEYLIPLVSINGVDHFYNANDIDFDLLPEKFVMKCNHASGYNFIVEAKSELSEKEISKIKKRLNKWLSKNFAYVNGLELVYRDITPCIVIEEFMGTTDELIDYKFLCFSGKPKYVWLDEGRYLEHRRCFLDMDYNEMPFTFNTFDRIKNPKKPDNFGQMKEIAKKLCGNYPFVRVDLYNIRGRIYFGEVTYSSASGYTLPNPPEYDHILSDEIIIDLSKREEDKRYRKQ